LMTQGGPAGATDALVVKIYFEAFRFFKAGPAFAMGAMLLVAATLLAAIYGFVARGQSDV
ncbi:MAG: sugar ABC transporter permease, partial [Hyphomicrobiales bacterium]|nr:sugar ABC transporter permease [Hyphomicrobiales bacterium]